MEPVSLLVTALAKCWVVGTATGVAADILIPDDDDNNDDD